MNDVNPLLAAKLLHPSPGRFHLDRPRLFERLREGLNARACVVVAGPGYGKTTLVARFLREIDDPSVWLRLDPSDRDPWMLFRYLSHALREHAPDFGERSEGVWRDLRSRSSDVERLADVFIADAEESLGGRVVLVLDGIQHLEDPNPCAAALRRLLAYLPGALHLILVGRALPELGLRALSAEAAVSILPGDDLRFTGEETQALLRDVFGLQLPPATVEKVHRRSRGWVTALQLLRQTTRIEGGTVDVPEEVFAGTDREIFDYFTEEAFHGEPEPVQEFLLGSAPPEVLDAEVCEDVLQGIPARAILADLLRRSFFVSPLAGRGELCAYDPLFREFLTRRLRLVRGPDGERALHARYGRTFARRGEYPLALAHLLAAQELGATMEILARKGKELLRGGMLQPVRDAAGFAARNGGRATVVEDLLGEVSRLAGDHAAAVLHFERALAAAQAGPGEGADAEPAEAAAARQASVLQGLSYSLLKTGAVSRAAETAEQALAVAGDADPALAARILNTLSIVRYRQHRLPEALEGWQRALARARQAADGHLTLMIAHNLGLPHAAGGDFRRAAECFLMLTGPDNPRAGPEEGAAYLNLARVETIWGDHPRAGAHLDDAREIATRWRLQGLEADVLEAEGNLLRESGDLAAAGRKYDRARALFMELGRTDLLPGLEEEAAVLTALLGNVEEAERVARRLVAQRRETGEEEGLASSLLALGEIQTRAGSAAPTGDTLAEAADRFQALGRPYQECLARLWLALARLRQGDRAGARAAASAALALASRHDYRAAVLRAAAFEPAFRRFLASLPMAPSYLKRAPSPAIVARGPITTAVAGDPPDLTVRLLGPVDVHRDPDLKIPARAWKIRRALQIFCLLASSRDHRATKDRIVDALFGEARPSAIEKNFHPTISFLRRALNHGHNVPKNFILCDRGSYQLHPAYRYDIDTERFEASLRSAKDRAAGGDHAAALTDLEQALVLYRGPFMEEEYDDWVEAPRAHYEQLYRRALREAGELHQRAGDREAGVACLRRLVEHDPLDEDASARLMRALGTVGHRGSVEQEWARLAKTLSEDLSAEPLPETREAYEEALTLGAAAPPPTPRKRGASGRRSV